MNNKKPKILIWDIETSFMELKFPTFSLYGNEVISHKYINQEPYIHCIGYKWLDSKKSHVLSAFDNKKRFKKDHTDDFHVVSEFRKILIQADLMIGHNLDKFDVKKFNTRLIRHGLESIIIPPTIDTLKSAKKYFSFPSNRLDYIAQFLGYEGKLNTGTGLWDRCFKGELRALKEMSKYCKEDIRVTEDVYLKLRKYIHNHPNMTKVMGKYGRKVTNCAACNSSDIFKDGTQVLKYGRYQYHKCRSCGYRSKGEKV